MATFCDGKFGDFGMHAPLERGSNGVIQAMAYLAAHREILSPPPAADLRAGGEGLLFSFRRAFPGLLFLGALGPCFDFLCFGGMRLCCSRSRIRERSLSRTGVVSYLVTREISLKKIAVNSLHQ